ncbi:oxidoreductase [Sinomonas mesophila]|uniref:oxidoreductase n=1 Tax=Sinomonas mesophila TaxID=1531955 RepID=UPI00158E7F3A|nr:oxidoreductase [Sinomonas mesophila]
MDLLPVALVTGASSGIGAETARALARSGYTVYGAARRVDRLEPLADDGVRPLALDLTDDASLTAGVEGILGETGRIDVLVNNAGYGSYGPLEDVPLEEARGLMEVNLFGLARLIQLVLPGMRERGSGTIVNVSSIGGKFYEPLGSWYHASKFAVEGLSDSLRIELRPFGIKVVIIEPGPILSEWSATAVDTALESAQGTAYAESAKRVAAVMAGTYVPGRASEPDVVARAIVRAVRSRHPRPRYAVGAGAPQLMALRKILPDRAFDLLVRTAYRH